MHHPTDSIAHITAFVTPVVEHWLEREIAQWVHPMKDRSDDPSHHERTTLLPRSYIWLLIIMIIMIYLHLLLYPILAFINRSNLTTNNTIHKIVRGHVTSNVFSISTVHVFVISYVEVHVP